MKRSPRAGNGHPLAACPEPRQAPTASRWLVTGTPENLANAWAAQYIGLVGFRGSLGQAMWTIPT